VSEGEGDRVAMGFVMHLAGYNNGKRYGELVAAGKGNALRFLSIRKFRREEGGGRAERQCPSGGGGRSRFKRE